MSDTSTPKQDTRFQPGQSGNPAGRPRGSRSILDEEFLRDVLETWRVHGKTALEKVAQEQPAVLVKAVAALLPRQVVNRHTGAEGGAIVVDHQNATDELVQRLNRLAERQRELAQPRTPATPRH